MRKVILGLAVSLDGFIEGPNGEYDWCFTDQDYGMSEFFKRIDAVFVGRKSYEMWFGPENDDMSWMPRAKSYVFSNTLSEVKGDAILVSGEIEAMVKEIKNEEGKDIWLYGGASLTTSLLNAGLVDELWLSIHPILLGRGKHLFSDIDHRILLGLQESKAYDTGLVSVRYTITRRDSN